MVAGFQSQAESMMQANTASPNVVRSNSPSRANTRMALAWMPSLDEKDSEKYRKEEKDWIKRTLTSIQQECEQNLANSAQQESFDRSNINQSALPKSDSPRGDMMSQVPLHIQRTPSKDSHLSANSDKAGQNSGYDGPASDFNSNAYDALRNDSKPRRASMGQGSKESNQGGAWRRSVSKEPRIPSKTSGRTGSKSSMMSEGVEDPNFMWEKYLKHFTNEQLNWISEFFEDFSQENDGYITKEQAAHIATVWVEDHYQCDNSAPTPKDVQEIIVEVVGRPADWLTFEHLVFFVAKCEHRILKADQRAGFSESDVLTYKETFLAFCKGESNKTALTTIDIFEVLEDMGYDNLTLDQKQLIRGFIAEADIDKSGDIDLMEFLQLMRKVNASQAEMDRQSEHEFIKEANFNDGEVDSYHDLYNHFSGEDGNFSQMDLREVICNLDIELDLERKKQLDQLIQSVKKRKDGVLKKDANKNRRGSQEGPNVVLLTFGEFLLLFRKMMDIDFAGMNAKSAEIIAAQEEEKRYLSPEEYEAKRRESLDCQLQANKTSSWVKRMIEKKDEHEQKKMKARASISEGMIDPKQLEALQKGAGGGGGPRGSKNRRASVN